MFVLAHLAAGLIVGKVFHNYTVALAFALFIDLDHLISYFKNKIFDFKSFWRVITDPLDPYGNQRNFLHSFFAWAFLSIIVFLIDFDIGIVASLSYLSHLFLDMLDGSDFYPFYPVKFNFIGPVKYLSLSEFVFTFALLVIWVLV